MALEVPIDSRRDYEMYVKQRVALMTISSKNKAIVRKLVMQGFDDGIVFQNHSGNCTVEVRENL